MKTNTQILTLALFFALTNFAHAQEKGDLIKLKTYNKILKTENLGPEANDSIAKFLSPGIVFRINEISEKTGQTKLKALHFKKKNSKEAYYFNDKIYFVSNEDFENSYEAHVPEEKLSIGFLTFPFKVRFQDEFSFDTEFNFNTAISWNIHRVYQSKLNLQAGIGMGNVRLNQNNASGIGVGKEQNVATLNLFGGLMLEHKKAQIGIYLGVDHINNQR